LCARRPERAAAGETGDGRPERRGRTDAHGVGGESAWRWSRVPGRRGKPRLFGLYGRMGRRWVGDWWWVAKMFWANKLNWSSRRLLCCVIFVFKIIYIRYTVYEKIFSEWVFN